MPRQITLSVSQIQSLALKTMGYRPDMEVPIYAPYDDSMEITADVINVRLGIDYDGEWRVHSLDRRRDSDYLLDQGVMPKFWEWREH